MKHQDCFPSQQTIECAAKVILITGFVCAWMIYDYLDRNFPTEY